MPQKDFRDHPALLLQGNSDSSINPNRTHVRKPGLAGLVPVGVGGWVPEHFYAEVLAVLRRQLLVEKLITEAQATVALDGFGRGSCAAPRSHHSSMPLGPTGTT